MRLRLKTTKDSSSVPILTVKDLRFGWQAADRPIIALDAFAVDAGETVFISGPSGSGKSTLLSLVGGVVVPTSGRIELIGQDIGALSGTARDRIRADHIGIIFQQFNLVPYLSIVDNVILPCRFSKARRERLRLQGLSAADEVQRLLSRLDLSPDLQSRPVTELSIGQQQRVAVARALIGGPSLIIADEPTSALDEHASERFLSLLFDECRASGAAVLFVSHDTRLASRFDRQLSLADINKQRACA